MDLVVSVLASVEEAIEVDSRVQGNIDEFSVPTGRAMPSRVPKFSQRSPLSSVQDNTGRCESMNFILE